MKQATFLGGFNDYFVSDALSGDVMEGSECFGKRLLEQCCLHAAACVRMHVRAHVWLPYASYQRYVI